MGGSPADKCTPNPPAFRHSVTCRVSTSGGAQQTGYVGAITQHSCIAPVSVSIWLSQPSTYKADKFRPVNYEGITSPRSQLIGQTFLPSSFYDQWRILWKSSSAAH